MLNYLITIAGIFIALLLYSLSPRKVKHKRLMLGNLVFVALFCTYWSIKCLTVI
jgi:hypothetical protein